MRATILVENESARPDLREEHGLAVWIETTDHRILFDTGASDAVVHNARALGIDLGTADVVVLSHGHQDHAGGLAAVARTAGGAAIYGGNGVAVPKYSRRDSGLKEIGVDPQIINAVAHRLRTAQDGQVLVPGVTVISGFPQTEPVPSDNDKLLVRGESGLVKDPFVDEIALLVDTKSGPVLLTGCSHAGIGNVVRKGMKVAGHLAGLIGGFHLHKESDRTIREVSRALTMIPRIHAAHCTGERAANLLAEILGKPVAGFSAGTIIEFE